MRERLRIAAPVIVAMALASWNAPPRASAQTIWIDGFGDWFNAANWSVGVPNPASPTAFDAQINNGGTALILPGAGSVRRITLGAAGGQVGAVIVDAGSLTVNEQLNVGEGGAGQVVIANGGDASAVIAVLGVLGGATGEMTVADPGSTLLTNTLILGELGSGTMTIGAGADVTGQLVSLANSSASAFGKMIVSEPGSTLVANGTFWIGRTGVGELTVAAGGAVTAPAVDIGSNAFGSGLATILGAGSTLSSTNTLLVGNNGFGTIMIADGGRVNSIALTLGFASGGSGAVTVTGAGSRLVDTFNSIHVGEAGSGTLSIAAGGVVNVNSGLGSVVVGAAASGFASKLRIGTGGAPGTLEAGSVSLLRANSLLELNHTGVTTLAMPISGPGAVTQIANGTTTFTANNTFTGPLTVNAGFVELSAGGQINNAAESNVVNGVGQVAAVRITGAGSKWINAGSTFIGAVGTGSVSVEAGGELRSDSEIIVNRFSNGNGALIVTGPGSKATTSGEFRIADEGVGLVAVQDGGAITTGSLVELARQSTGNASAIVTGSGSLWTIGGILDVGRRGTGALRIENGGKVRNLSNFGIVGDEAGSIGTAEIVGPASAWESSSLIVARTGTGTATVSGGGSIATGATTLGLNAGSNATALVTGAGSTWSSSGTVIVGSLGTSTLTIADGATFTTGGGTGAVNVAALPGSIGTLWIGAGAAPGTLSAGSVVFGQGSGQLVFNHTGGIAFSIPISGPGSVRHLGAGTTTLSANSNYAGGTAVERGVLAINNSSGLALGSGAITVHATPASELRFIGNSKAGGLPITNRGNTITDVVGGRTVFVDNSTADASAIFNQAGTTEFFAGGGQTEFRGNSTAGAATITNFGESGSVAAGGRTSFWDHASAGAATILNEPSSTSGASGNVGWTLFNGNSSAGDAVIHNKPALNASGNGGLTTVNSPTSTAANATIYNYGGQLPGVRGGASVIYGTAGNATIIQGGAAAGAIGGKLFFSGLSQADLATAGGATIINQGAGIDGAGGGETIFEGWATAGGALITNEGGAAANALGGVTIFLRDATAGAATIHTRAGTVANAQGGGTRFEDTATAGNAVFNAQGAGATNAYGGLVRFTENSNAGAATFHIFPSTNAADIAGNLYFEGSSSAAAATINNRGGVSGFGGHTFFFGSATAASSTILNEGGTTTSFASGSTFFFGTATAGSAAITATGGAAPNAYGGATNFFDDSAAGAATVAALGGVNGGLGGQIFFEDQASGGDAAFVVQGNGYFTIENLSTAGTTAGSISGSGSYRLGNKTLTVGNNNTSTTVSGAVSGAGGSLTKVGAGALTLSGANSFTGALTVNQGSLFVTGSIATAATVNSGGTLGGTGTLAAATINAGGALSPGTSVGTLTTGNLTLAAGSLSKFELSTPGVAGGVNDLVAVNGSLAFGGSLAITTLPGFGPGTYPLFTYTTTATNLGLAFESSFLTAHPGSTIVLDSLNKRVVANITGTSFLAADFDENGVVNGADLTKWRMGFGTTGSATHMQGDADSDHDVDGGDFLTWQRQLGSGAAGAASGAVPEPSSWALLVITAVGCRLSPGRALIQREYLRRKSQQLIYR